MPYVSVSHESSVEPRQLSKNSFFWGHFKLMQDIKEMLIHSFPRSGFAGSYDIDVVLPNAGDARLTGEKADQKESVCQSVRTSF